MRFTVTIMLALSILVTQVVAVPMSKTSLEFCIHTLISIYGQWSARNAATLGRAKTSRSICKTDQFNTHGMSNLADECNNGHTASMGLF
jgi:hypothetical protein